MAENTQSVDIKGRTVTVRQPNDAQLALMHRNHRLGIAALSRFEELAAVDEKSRNEEQFTRAAMSSLESVSRLLDILEGLIVDPIDRNWLVGQMSLGELGLEDVLPVLQSLIGPEEKTKGKPVKKATRVSTV